MNRSPFTLAQELGRSKDVGAHLAAGETRQTVGAQRICTQKIWETTSKVCLAVLRLKKQLRVNLDLSVVGQLIDLQMIDP